MSWYTIYIYAYIYKIHMYIYIQYISYNIYRERASCFIVGLPVTREYYKRFLALEISATRMGQSDFGVFITYLVFPFLQTFDNLVKHSKDTDKLKDTATTKAKSKKKISKCTSQQFKVRNLHLSKYR